MQIGIFGNGKMGQIIARLAEENGHEIAWKISRENRAEFTPDRLGEAEISIEFTRPESAFENVMACLRAGRPVVCGTTGWAERLPEIQKCIAENGGQFFWASNFSIGVNLFFELNRRLAAMMAGHENYRPTITEIHHIHKLDAPSGTAITLAEGLILESKRLKNWVNAPDLANSESIFIESRREGEVPGTHVIQWKSAVDTLEISHVAHSREGFASGAIQAASWLLEQKRLGRNGFFQMPDMLGIG